MMDTVRYAMGVFCMVVMPPAGMLWTFVHPLAWWWRKVGAVTTYLVILPVLVGFAVVLFRLRERLLGADLGTNWALIGVAGVFYALMVPIEIGYRKHLTFSTLIGLPELAKTGTSGAKLLREGIYARVRHPRYLSVTLSLIGHALVANYVGVYLFVLFLIPAGAWTMWLEERELVQRYGLAYRDYQRDVPQLLPHRPKNWRRPFS